MLHAATRMAKGNPVLYAPIRRFVLPLLTAARNLVARTAAFALSAQPLTRYVLTPVRIDRIANLEVKGELDRESITVQTVFPEDPVVESQPHRMDGEQHFLLRNYRSGAGRVATITRGRFWLPGMAVTSSNRTFLSDALRKLSVQSHENAIRSMPFTRAQKLPGVTGLIAVNRPETYFHWIVEAVPRFLMLEEAGGWSRYDRIVSPRIDKRFQQETIDRIGVPRTLLDESQSSGLIEAEHLVVPLLQNPVERFPAWLPREMAARFCPETPPRDALIYVSRSDAPARKVENENEVIACLEPFGFRAVTLSGMSVAAQAHLFASARMVVGPHGAGFANLLFCKPGTILLEFFSPQYVNFVYWSLARGAGISYNYMLGEGPQPPESVEPLLGSVPMRISVENLRRAIERIVLLQKTRAAI